MEFKTGYILETYQPLKWYKPMSWLSNLIRFFCKTKYSHTGIIVNNWNIPFIDEAISSGVTASPLLDAYKGHHIRISEMYGLNMSERQVAVKANSKVGITPYDFSGLLFYQLIYQLTGHWTGPTNAGRAEDKMFCYEFVGWVINEEKWWEFSPKQMEIHPRRKTIFEGVL